MKNARRVLVVDYGRAGNLLSVSQALARAGASVSVSSDPKDLEKADCALLPGVGAFGDGMQSLRSGGFVEPLRRFCAASRPLLGICLGMQLLLSEGEEFGRHEGLGIIPGRVCRLPSPPPEGLRWKVPHIGWTAVRPPSGRPVWDGTPFAGISDEPFFYFVHSYHAIPEDPRLCTAEALYGSGPFCAALAAGSVTGSQFHPEKSGEAGLRFLANWLSTDPQTPSMETGS